MPNYRQLTPADLPMVLEMNKTFREGFVVKENAAAFLADSRNWIFAAVEADQIIAFAYGYELPRLNNIGNMLYIHEVGVAEPFQRRGIGTAMLAALREACREKGICRYFLFTDQKNIAANALYRKVGGEVSYDSHGQDTCYFFQTQL